MRIGILNGFVGGQGGRNAVPDTVDVVVQNVAGTSISLGYAAAYTTTAASVDGSKVVLPAAANALTFAGIATEHIPDNGVGLVRAYGYMSTTYIFATGTSGTVGAGVAMGPAAASLGVNSTGLVDTFGPVVSMQAIGAAINSPGGYAKTLVRAL